MDDSLDVLATLSRLEQAEAILKRLVDAGEGTDDVYDVLAEARRYFGLNGEE